MDWRAMSMGWFILCLGLGELAYAQGCRCAPGYSIGIGGNLCTKKLIQSPLAVLGTGNVVAGDGDSDHLSHLFYSVEASGNLNRGFFTDRGNFPLRDSTGSVMASQSVPRFQEWLDRVDPANSVVIQGDREGVWFSKTFCLSIPETKHHVFFVGGDNFWKVKINGNPYAECTSDYCFRHGLFIGQDLGAGDHFIELRYRDEWGPGALWFEVYQNETLDLQTRPPSQLNRIFSTHDLMGQRWDYASGSGEVCPPGYAYDSCSTQQCVKYDDRPCEPNLKVEDAACGTQAQVAFHNTTGGAIEVGWSFYRLNSDGSRMLPALALSQKRYAVDADWSGSLQELFPGQNLSQAMLTHASDLSFELAASVDVISGGGHWDYASKFKVKQIPIGIFVTNEPGRPDPTPLSGQPLSELSVYVRQPVRFLLNSLLPSAPALSGVEWLLTQGLPSSGHSNPITATWNQFTPRDGVPVGATATFSNGCISRQEMKLIINDDRGPSVPTAFSPNGDGLNDVFKPLGVNLDWYEFSVYSRYGERVYQHLGGGQPKGWDGRYLGHTRQYAEPQGVHSFVVVGKWKNVGDHAGPMREYKGTVTLIR